MFDLIRRTNWNELYYHFAKGEPSLILQLLGFNLIFFLLFALRRMRNAPPLRTATASALQSLLLAANIVIVLRESIIHGVGWVF
jgi:hypothetical protein